MISIVVMLILAGVSLNATVGDNGIISKSQEATFKQSAAVLSEYFNQIYINDELDNLVDVNEDGSVKSNVEKMIDKHSEWFYSNEGKNYIIHEYTFTDENGNTQNGFLKLRLVRKNQLPEDIKNQIRGGDAIGRNGNVDSSDAYEQFKDVYGVTGDLQVYYCKDGIATAIGANYTSSASSDSYDGTKTMYDSNSSLAQAIAKTLGTDAQDLSMQDLVSIKELEISDSLGMTNLESLHDLPNLTKLTLKNYKGSLKGLEKAYKLNYIYFNNENGSQNIDFTGLSGATKLSEIKFYKPTDIEFSKMCEEMSKTDYSNLDNIYLVGVWYEYWVYYSNSGNSYGNQGLCDLTSISPLSKLTDITKKRLTKITVASTKINSLNGLEDFSNITSARLSSNYLTNVNEMSSMNKLSYLELSNNTTLTDVSGIQNLTKLSNVVLRNCSNLNNIIAVIKNSLPNYINASGCTNLDFSGADWIENNNAMKKKLENVTTLDLPSKYSLLFSNRKYITLSSSATWAEISALKENSKIEYLNFGGNKNLTDANIQELLVSLPNIKNINLDNTNVASLNFASEKTNINRISFESTFVTDITPLYGCISLGYIKFNATNATVVLYKEGDTTYNNKIITIIERTYDKNCSEDEYNIMGHGGGFCPLATTYFTQINKLTNLTKFFMRYYSAGNYGFDFSNTNLTKIYMQMSGGYTIKVPRTIQYISSVYTLYYQADVIDNIKSLGSNGSSLLKCSNVNTVFNSSQNGCTVSFGGDVPGDFSTLNGYFGDWVGTFSYSKASAGIKYGTFSSSVLAPMINCNSIGINCKNVSRLDGLDFANYTRDFSLTLNGVGITKFDNVNYAPHLKSLNLTNNRISDVSFLLKNYQNSNIERLTLSNNLLEGYTTYKNEDGRTVTESTISILLKLPNLKYLDLSGNGNLTNFSELQNAGFIETGENTRIFQKK